MKRIAAALLPLVFAWAHKAPELPPPNFAGLVEEADRTDDDKALDAGRKPVQLLEFAGVRPGMNVADLASGSGYTTELLARAVAPTGKVYAQNPDAFVKFVGEKWTERLARPVNQNVVRVEREMESPLPIDVSGLDVVISNLVYHDFVWLGTDRPSMNRAIFDSLKSGGVYVVLDHSAPKGHGVDDVKTTHRIEEDTVIAEITAAGFKLDKTGDFLRNADDTRDWNASPSAAAEKRGQSDRFALRFVKP